jgi:CheY-like chemotaxis protein
MASASVLVVDDNEIMRDTLKGFLETEGYSVVSCEDGPSALRLSKQKRFEIVLTDFQMPEMNGDEMIKQLREDQPETFIVGFSIGNKEQSFLDAGANRFLKKEQLLTDLVPIIENRN